MKRGGRYQVACMSKLTAAMLLGGWGGTEPSAD